MRVPRLPPRTPAIAADPVSRFVRAVALGPELRVPMFEHGLCAGFPSPADDFLEGALELPRWLAPNPPATFLWRMLLAVGAWWITTKTRKPGQRRPWQRRGSRAWSATGVAGGHRDLVRTRLACQ